MFLAPIIGAWLWYFTDQAWLFLVPFAPWVLILVGGLIDVVRGRITQRTIDENPTPWYTP